MVSRPLRALTHPWLPLSPEYSGSRNGVPPVEGIDTHNMNVPVQERMDLVEMVSRPLRALTPLQLTPGQGCGYPVEMVSRPLRALTQFFQDFSVLAVWRRNGVPPVEGIDTP